MKKAKYYIINKTESLMQSITKDLFTYVGLAFLIYISRESTFWTFITGGIFIMAFFGKIKLLFDERYKSFETIGELKQYVDSFKEDAG